MALFSTVGYYLVGSYFELRSLFEYLFSENRKCIQLFLSPFPFSLTFAMNFYARELKLNLLPPDILYCDFNYWSSLFTQDISILWEKDNCVPLKNLPSDVSDMIFPYLLLALSDYKILNKKTLNGIGLDNLLNLWFDKYSLNKNGYFQLTSLTRKNII